MVDQGLPAGVPLMQQPVRANRQTNKMFSPLTSIPTDSTYILCTYICTYILHISAGRIRTRIIFWEHLTHPKLDVPICLHDNPPKAAGLRFDWPMMGPFQSTICSRADHCFQSPFPVGGRLTFMIGPESYFNRRGHYEMQELPHF